MHKFDKSGIMLSIEMANFTNTYPRRDMLELTFDPVAAENILRGAHDDYLEPATAGDTALYTDTLERLNMVGIIVQGVHRATEQLREIGAFGQEDSLQVRFDELLADASHLRRQTLPSNYPAVSDRAYMLAAQLLRHTIRQATLCS